MKAEGRRWMSDEHHQKMQIQRYLNKMASSAFHTQYSIVPTFHFRGKFGSPKKPTYSQ
jgi:hypothetical protein